MKTPNLDRMVKEGVVFDNAYCLSPVCGPSRASIFTGQYSSVHGRRDNFYYPDGYDVYLPQAFKDGGYRTALIGKYYEGNPFKPQARKAFDRWFESDGVVGGNPQDRASYVEYYREHMYIDQQYDVDGKKLQILGHQTDIVFAEAARFATENADKPFCTFLSPFAPHEPFNMTERNKGRYKGKGIPECESQNFGIGFFKNPNQKARVIEKYEQYCEMIADIDDVMGVLLDALEESGQLDNTFIILTSDNGYMFGEHGFVWKRHPWQESLRVPFIVRYPKLAKAGAVNSAMVALSDMFFTCADLADIKMPEVPYQHGRSFLPVLTGEKQQIRDSMLYIQYEKIDRAKPRLPELMLWAGIIRNDGWKLATYNVPDPYQPDLGPDLLFNLTRDGSEMKNCAENPEYSDVLRTMKTAMRQELDANLADSSWLK
jgi:N-acetylglucosamine-6-sulfatase